MQVYFHLPHVSVWQLPVWVFPGFKILKYSALFLFIKSKSILHSMLQTVTSQLQHYAPRRGDFRCIRHQPSYFTSLDYYTSVILLFTRPNFSNLLSMILLLSGFTQLLICPGVKKINNHASDSTFTKCPAWWPFYIHIFIKSEYFRIEW